MFCEPCQSGMMTQMLPGIARLDPECKGKLAPAFGIYSSCPECGTRERVAYIAREIHNTEVGEV